MFLEIRGPNLIVRLQCIFLGYGHEEFGYRFWDLVTKKIIWSKDVVFFEDQTIEDMEQTKKPISL
jgi:hypothetical protein